MSASKAVYRNLGNSENCNSVIRETGIMKCKMKNANVSEMNLKHLESNQLQTTTSCKTMENILQNIGRMDVLL